MQVLHFVSDLDSTSSATSIGLLGKYLAGPITQRVVCLGAPGNGSQLLHQTSTRIDSLNWTRFFDPGPLWRLRHMLHSEPPNLIHVWGLAALRCLGLVGRRWLPRTVVSIPHAGRRPNLGRLDRWLLGRARTVITSSQAEAEGFRQAGVPDCQVAVIPPGVDTPGDAPVEQIEAQPLTKSAQRILCLGEPSARRGFRDAIWAFDMLHYVFQEARLGIASSGADRQYLKWFAERLEIARHVDFLDPRAEGVQSASGADLCWAPIALGVTQQAVLEAMAAGRPVIVADQPALREIVADQETGYLIPESDKVELCKRTRSLFLDPSLARHLGDAARRRALREFSADAFARNWSEQYARVA